MILKWKEEWSSSDFPLHTLESKHEWIHDWKLRIFFLRRILVPQHFWVLRELSHQQGCPNQFCANEIFTFNRQTWHMCYKFKILLKDSIHSNIKATLRLMLATRIKLFTKILPSSSCLSWFGDFLIGWRFLTSGFRKSNNLLVLIIQPN